MTLTKDGGDRSQGEVDMASECDASDGAATRHLRVQTRSTGGFPRVRWLLRPWISSSHRVADSRVRQAQSPSVQKPSQARAAGVDNFKASPAEVRIDAELQPQPPGNFREMAPRPEGPAVPAMSRNSSIHNEENELRTSIEAALNRTEVAGQAMVVALACCLAVPALAQTTREVQATIKPGSTAVVDTVGCAVNIKGSAAGSLQVVPSGTKTLLIYSSTADQREDRSFTADVGTKASADGKSCEESVNRQYTLTFNASPEVSGKALQTSFQVLMAAFVLALLLESAFTLIFNWRPFNAFLVGRSVRSPIMFLASLLLVHQFHFDLMAQLFDAYSPGGGGQSSFGTGVLTAMILAGGSAGVNRILTTLGFRSQFKDGEVPPTPDETHAWIAVAVESVSMKDKLMVAVSEVTPAAGASVSTAVGIAGARRPGWRSLFLGDDFRVPRSGGMRVDVSKFYTITVTNLGTGVVYDVTGAAVAAGGLPTIFRFGSRAVLDFRIKLS